MPAQIVLDSKTEALASGLEIDFPVVLKPEASVVSDGTSRRKLGVVHATTRSGGRAALAALPPSAYPVLVQRRIGGDGVGTFLLRWDGRTVAEFANRRSREKPPSGGVSVYRESLRVPPAWRSQAERLLTALD